MTPETEDEKLDRQESSAANLVSQLGSSGGDSPLASLILIVGVVLFAYLVIRRVRRRRR